MAGLPQAAVCTVHGSSASAEAARFSAWPCTLNPLAG